MPNSGIFTLIRPHQRIDRFLPVIDVPSVEGFVKTREFCNIVTLLKAYILSKYMLNETHFFEIYNSLSFSGGGYNQNIEYEQFTSQFERCFNTHPCPFKWNFSKGRESINDERYLFGVTLCIRGTDVFYRSLPARFKKDLIWTLLGQLRSDLYSFMTLIFVYLEKGMCDHLFISK